MEGVIVKMFKVNNSHIKNQCYVIYKNNEGILVDPAWDYDLIDNFLIENNISLKAILLTHSHIDHTNLAEKFTRSYDTPVFMSAEEVDYYNFEMTNLIKVYHLKEIIIASFRVIPIVTPGHTEGSTCYLVDGNLFSGDTVFIEGVGICAPKNTEKLYDSVQFLKEFVSDETLYWPGHSFGEATGKDHLFLLKNNIYFQFDNKENFIQFRNRKKKPNPFAFT